MRERLVAALVGLTVVVVVLYGVPRAYLLADVVRTGEQARVERTALALAAVLDQRADAGQPVTTRFLDSLAADGEEIAYREPDGQEVSTAPDGEDGAGGVSASRSLADGGELTVTRTASAVQSGISRAVLVLVLQGLVLVALAALIGIVMARRLARPFLELAEAARGLGHGRFRVELPEQHVPEAREIGRALVETGTQLDVLLRHEREVAVRASHELRTPVTAMRLELEDLALWPETPPPVAEALGHCVQELDRLSSAIADLLALSETSHRALAIDLDLDALVAEVVAGLDTTDHPVVHRVRAPAPTRLEPALVAEVVRLLVEQLRGEGADVVETSVVPQTSHYEVRVSGGPDRRRPAALPGPDDEAAGLAAASGGQITREGATLVLRLPRNQVGGAASGGTAGPPPG